MIERHLGVSVALIMHMCSIIFDDRKCSHWSSHQQQKKHTYCTVIIICLTSNFPFKWHGILFQIYARSRKRIPSIFDMISTFCLMLFYRLLLEGAIERKITFQFDFCCKHTKLYGLKLYFIWNNLLPCFWKLLPQNEMS